MVGRSAQWQTGEKNCNGWQVSPRANRKIKPVMVGKSAQWQTEGKKNCNGWKVSPMDSYSPSFLASERSL